jgi:hypothetical protein
MQKSAWLSIRPLIVVLLLVLGHISGALATKNSKKAATDDDYYYVEDGDDLVEESRTTSSTKPKPSSRNVADDDAPVATSPDVSSPWFSITIVFGGLIFIGIVAALILYIRSQKMKEAYDMRMAQAAHLVSGGGRPAQHNPNLYGLSRFT